MCFRVTKRRFIGGTVTINLNLVVFPTHGRVSAVVVASFVWDGRRNCWNFYWNIIQVANDWKQTRVWKNFTSMATPSEEVKKA